MKANLSLLALYGAATGAASYAQTNTTLPTVELPYVTQRATFLNTTSGNLSIPFYSFTNVRFAAPPVDELRFQKPVAPLQEANGTILDGSEHNDTWCAQFFPPIDGYPQIPPEGIIRGQEDCLFMDIYVPKSVFDNRETEKVPVLGYWYGGGYISGSKDTFGIYQPSGLYEAGADSPFIFVAANYRLGAFGWLAEPADKVTPNAGLYDVKAALEWIETNIHLFGGDTSRFTAMGESAGAGVLTHMLTSFGGTDPLPFQQALLQSPGWAFENPLFSQRDLTYNSLLTQTNCSSFDCLQSVDFDILQAANVNTSMTFGYAPVVDGADGIVPDLAQNLMAQGRVHQVESVFQSNCRFEGRLPLQSRVNETGLFRQAVHELLDVTVSSGGEGVYNVSEKVYAELEELYSYAATEYEAAVDVYSDYWFDCISRWTAETYSSTADPQVSESGLYRYIFNLGQAQHAADILYSFGIPEPADGPNGWHEQAIVSYTVSGVPSTQGDATPWLEWGASDGTAATWLNETTIGEDLDPWGRGAGNANERCQYFFEGRQFAT